MAPTLIHLSAQLRQLIYCQLDNNLIDNALFLAGRLHALDHKNPDFIHLLALCHQRLGQHKAAYDYTKPIAVRGIHLGCTYIFAQASLVIGKIADGINALERCRSIWESRIHCNKKQDGNKRYTPDAAAVYAVLGDLYSRKNDKRRGAECFAAALKLNPFMWESFERICTSGTKVKVQNIYKNSPELFAALSPPSAVYEDTRPPSSTASLSSSGSQTLNAAHEGILSRSRQNTLSSSNVTNHSNHVMSNGYSAETPPSNGAPAKSVPRINHFQHADPPNAPPRRLRPGSAQGQEHPQDVSRMRSLSRRRANMSSTDEVDSQDLSHQTHNTAPLKRNASGVTTASNGANAIDPTQAPRRSRRLGLSRPNILKPPPPSLGFLSSKEPADPKKLRATGTRGRSATQSTVGRVVSGNRKPIENSENVLKESRSQPVVHVEVPPPQPSVTVLQDPEHDTTRAYNALQWLLDLFCRFGQGYNALSAYQNMDAVRHFNLLPSQQRDTPWVLAQIGKAYHEQGNYAEAEKSFARLRKLCPSRLDDMEVYSTVLWQLKNDTELSYLAQDLLDIDRSSPEAWCAIGNSFSLNRDHDQALKCFRRATQLDPSFSYGFTLQGHEQIANEDFEKALQAYRRALATDHRHYNGWYGLGKVYEKLGKADFAEKHYRAAAEINPTNVILLCNVGVVLEKLSKPQAALQQYRQALHINPAHGTSRFRCAKVLMNMQQHEGALQELKQLKDLVPDDANVHYMLGKVYKKLHNRTDALRHYTIAMNLDPKASHHIKEAMQALNDDYDEDLDDDDSSM